MVKTVRIVSLSAGTIGEPFAAHEVKIGVKRLEDMGLRVSFGAHALKGRDYIKAHPEDRAADLIEAFSDPDVDMILCAIGGDDTYRLLPYLFDGGRLQQALCDKVFLGFSDSTINHLMLHKLGLKTFYGQSFLADVCELENDMLPYSRHFLEELITAGRIREIRPSEVWYEERKAFDESQIGIPRIRHANRGFELLQGAPVFRGKILGGCLESMYDIFNNDRYPDTVSLCGQYGLFPSPEDWEGRILLLETSEEQPDPALYEKMLLALKRFGLFDRVAGVLAGKPMDEKYAEEYKKLLVRVIDRPELPILFNVNVGHATPRCIIPFGVPAVADAEKQCIRFEYPEDYSCRESELSPALLEELIRLSEDWEAENSCRGYRRNEAADIEGNRVFLAEEGEETVGYLFGHRELAKNASSVMPDGTPFFEVEELYVKPRLRSRGIGQALFRFAERAVAGEADYILLSTATKNWKAILHFYLEELGMDFWSARLFRKVEKP